MPDITTTTLLLLLLAALAAGWVDSVVGGGGLIQLPALLIAFPTAAPIHLLATNKMAGIAGTTTSSITYWRRVRPDGRTAVALAVPAFAGAIAGSIIASHLPRSAFNPIILVALVAVFVYTLRQPDLGHETELRYRGHRHLVTAGVAGFAIGVYDGALGPGTGSFLVFAMVGLMGYAFLEASAKAKVANLATNLASLVVFLPQGAGYWKLGVAMACANVAGGYLGARTAVAKGSGFVKIVFLVVVSAFICKLGYDVVVQFAR
ncbi:TSUP family transporter [Tsukamurella asaccharolytica]|uniref:Probable membrane transporter protein n=1 Tax=Tsukamurella asaccharolytica TaxID=2592067 RepID=A0A5C5RCM0_9ACTN|nr:TSUP family transporter [Tsukamurella asaccharolytica]TWS20827.1 TSUP family transporter [Tsukamurella asaccharolytica]